MLTEVATGVWVRLEHVLTVQALLNDGVSVVNLKMVEGHAGVEWKCNDFTEATEMAAKIAATINAQKCSEPVVEGGDG